MPITRIILRHFQAHRRLKIALSPTITTIVGKSRAGKSAIVRALRWAFLNDPPSRPIRIGSSRGQVRIDFDGRTLVRDKGKSHNWYRLDGETYKSFGTKVPDSIANVLNIGETNFQNQFDPHFWLSLSAGQISKEINQIVNLSVIDSSLANVASTVRRAKAEEEVTKSRLKNAEDKTKSLAWVENAAADYARLVKIERQHNAISSEIASVALLLESRSKYRLAKQNATELKSDAAKIIGVADQLLDATMKIVQLQDLIQKIEETEKEICRLKDAATKKKAGLTKKLNGLCPLCGQKIHIPLRSCVPIST